MNRFALLLAAGVSALTLASAAQAADLIISQPAPVGVVNVSGNWDGAFVGVFAGAGWATAFDADATTSLTFDITDYSGWLLGGDVGANFSAGNGIVLGVVGDIGLDRHFRYERSQRDPLIASLDWPARCVAGSASTAAPSCPTSPPVSPLVAARSPIRDETDTARPPTSAGPSVPVSSSPSPTDVSIDLRVSLHRSRPPHMTCRRPGRASFDVAHRPVGLQLALLIGRSDNRYRRAASCGPSFCIRGRERLCSGLSPPRASR